MRRALLLPLLLLLAWPATPAAAAPCRFILGFASFHDLLPGVVGDCMDDQAFSANGDAVQHTSRGLLAWRKADNWTAFTDGFRTWVNGPYGLQLRLNTERFPWEADLSAAPPPAASNSVSVSSNVANAATAVSGRVSGSGLGSVTATIDNGGAGGSTTITNVSSTNNSTPSVSAVCQVGGNSVSVSVGRVSAANGGTQQNVQSISSQRSCDE